MTRRWIPGQPMTATEIRRRKEAMRRLARLRFRNWVKSILPQPESLDAPPRATDNGSL